MATEFYVKTLLEVAIQAAERSQYATHDIDECIMDYLTLGLMLEATLSNRSVI